jgi:hypothetical protein
LLLTNLLHALKAKEAASKRRASVMAAAAEVAAVMAVAVEIVAAAAATAVADTIAIVVATAAAVDTTGINPHTTKLFKSGFMSDFFYVCYY